MANNFSLNEYLVIDTTGSVGIGTTNPTAKFQVTGSNTVANQTTAIFRAGNSTQTPGTAVLDVQDSASTSLLFVSGSGFVGIGTNTRFASDNLQIGNVSTSGARSIFLADNGWGLRISAGGGSSFIQSTGVAVPLQFYAGTSNNGNYLFTSTGNFGIGSGTNLTAKLLVTGSGAGATNTMHLVNSAGTSLMIVRDNGTVGIGTSTPALKLDFGTSGGFLVRANPGGATSVNYTGLAHNDLLIGSYIDGGSYSNHVVSFGHISDPARKFHFGSANSSTFNSSTGFVPTLTLTAGNNVGIGTTTPGARLEVTGSSSTSAAATFSAKNSSGTSLFYVRDDGNVGIGTASPAGRLDVASTTAPSIYATRPGLGSSYGAAGLGWLRFRDADNAFDAAAIYGVGFFPGSAGSLLFYSATGGSLVERARFDSSGSFGIGTNAPSARLHVTGSATSADQTALIRGGVPSQIGPVFEVED